MPKITRQVGKIGLRDPDPELDGMGEPMVRGELVEVELEDLSDSPSTKKLGETVGDYQMAVTVHEMAQMRLAEESYFLWDSVTGVPWVLLEGVFPAYLLEAIEMLDGIAKKLQITKVLEPRTLVVIRTGKELGKIGDYDTDESILQTIRKSLKGQTAVNIVLYIWSVNSFAARVWWAREGQSPRKN